MNQTTPPDLSIEHVSIESLRANPLNARTHSKRQVRQIAASLREFGFVNPILADKNGNIIAGHGRFAAAKLVGMTRLPVLRIEHLSPDQVRAYIIADNRLAELAGWDKSILAVELQHFMTDDVNLDVTVMGFELPEIDLILEGEAADRDKDDSINAGENEPRVSRLGDVWRLGHHAIVCANALEPASYAAVLDGRSAAMVFTDPPYTDKLVRLHMQTTFFENGNVHLPRQAPWLNDYVAEITGFPGTKYDDQVDSTTQALAYLREPDPLEVWRKFGENAHLFMNLAFRYQD
jgi:ParB-like nuclease family protein